MDELLRLLEIVQRRLTALDGRIELGGTPTSDPLQVWHEIAPHVRVVVTFAQPPADPEHVRNELHRITGGFVDTVLRAVEQAGGSPVRRFDHGAIVHALDVLAERAGAMAALIVDGNSPELWACSAPGLPWTNVEEAESVAETLRPRDVEPRAWQCARAIAVVRRHPERDEFVRQQPEPGIVARRLLGIYQVVLVLTPGFSELRATGAIRKALPALERLVRDMPPRAPEPVAARIVPLRPEP